MADNNKAKTPTMINNFTRTLTAGVHFFSLCLVICFSGVSMAEFDDALVEITREIEQPGAEETPANETLLQSSEAKFSRVGSKKTVEGILHEFSGCSQEKSSENGSEMEDENQTVPELPWIAYLHIPATEYGTSHHTHCSIIDKVKTAMLFGASAILVFSVHKRIFKKLDVSQIFSQPVVLISESYAQRVRQEYRRGRKLFIKIADSGPACNKYVQMYSTVTLWSTCFRPSEGSGVICPPSSTPEQTSSDSFGSFWTWSSLMAFILCACFLLKIKFQQWQEANWMQQVEKTLQQLAREALSNMKTRTLTSAGCGKFSKGQSDICAVCLDEFISGQIVRVLHCRHEFHTACVDPWLLRRRTCPLCKQDIIGDKTFASLAD